MAKVVTDDRHYKAIADAIRRGTEGDSPYPGKYKPSEMAIGVDYVAGYQQGLGYTYGYNDGLADNTGYSDGFSEGYSEGYSEGEQSGLADGIEQGKQTEYDRFWDAFQQNGRDDVDMRYMFYGWTDEAYNPKYPIRSSYSTVSAIFRAAAITSTIVDVDFSLTQVCSQAFYNATALVTIPKLIVCEENTFTNAFDNCSALVDIAVEGEFGQNINVQWSAALSKASITGIINALSGSASGKSVTLSKKAVDNAFTAEEWATLAATKTNWTINLV